MTSIQSLANKKTCWQRLGCRSVLILYRVGEGVLKANYIVDVIVGTPLALSKGKISPHFPPVLLSSMEGNVGFCLLACLGLIPGLIGSSSNKRVLWVFCHFLKLVFHVLRRLLKIIGKRYFRTEWQNIIHLQHNLGISILPYLQLRSKLRQNLLQVNTGAGHITSHGLREIG